MRAALAFAVLLAGCVNGAESADPVAAQPITVDGQVMLVRQEYDWPSMIYPVDATGQMTAVQSGTADTVIVAGTPEDRDLAIAALGQFCGRMIDPAGFDTQMVHRDAATGDWWFDGFRCRG